MFNSFGQICSHNNDGIVQQDPPDTPRDTLIIEDVTSKNNYRRGLAVRDSDITVKDSIFAYNGEDGIRIVADDNPTKVTFKGTVSSHHNKKTGIKVGTGASPWLAEVTVEGTLNTYLNGEDGMQVNAKIVMDPFTVADRASFNACENVRKDLNNFAPTGDVNFENYGTFTCGSTGGAGKDDIPTCVPCPACN